MECIRADIEHAEEIYRLVQDTITAVYPKYYPQEVVDFFCKLHSKEKITEDIAGGGVVILQNGTQLLGTGSCRENHITRVYVHPTFQKQGYGSYIMQILEQKIASCYDTVYLDASLPACHMYESRGYRTVTHARYPVENGVVLVYEVMQKKLE